MRNRILALLLAACLLAGCAARPDTALFTYSAEPRIPNFPGPWSWAPDTAPTRTESQRAYGSVGLLGWPSVLVSIYLDDAYGAAWSEAEIEQSRRYLHIAMDWIAEQCAAYNVTANIRYDDGTPDSPLFVHETFRGRFAGGQDIDESDDFYETVEQLCAALDTEELAQRYGTTSIGYLVFIPVEGNAFTMVHYYEDKAYYYYEYSCLYQYDAWSPAGTWDVPATYAHEILHLYGAPDLYEGSSDPFVTDELVQYIEDTWPDEIMNYTYEWDGSMRYDGISKVIGPLTAYRLGLTTRWEGMQAYPDVGAAPPGVFTDDNAPLPWSGRGDAA